MKKLAIKYISIILFIIILISISLFYLSEISISKDLNDLISMFWKILVNPIFKIGNTSISILNIIIAILIFSAGFIIGKLYKKNIKKLHINILQ